VRRGVSRLCRSVPKIANGAAHKQLEHSISLQVVAPSGTDFNQEFHGYGLAWIRSFD
jgi:hypothetical protein